MNIIHTPPNIMSMRREEVLDLIDELSDNKLYKSNSYLESVEIAFKAINYTCTNDFKLALGTQTNVILVDAQAGAGKSSFAMIWLYQMKKVYKTIHKKPLPASNILCLVYNRHNPKVLRRKHEIFINNLVSKRVIDPDPLKSKIQDTLEPCTLHKFSLNIINKYGSLLGYDDLRLDDEVSNSVYLGIAQTVLSEQTLKDKSLLGNVTSLVELYYNEMVFTFPEEQQEEIILENYQMVALLDALKINVPQFLTILSRSNETKMKYSKTMSYLDALVYAYEIITKLDIVREALQEQYSHIVVDEVQDFSPLMYSIFKPICTENTKVLCIGDGDQRINGYRGASLETFLDFSRIFPSVKVFQLLTNFRCSEQVLKFADAVINQVQQRSPKSLIPVHNNGSAQLHGYVTRDEADRELVEQISRCLSKKNTVLCREQSHATSITYAFYKKGLTYYLQNAMPFFKHPGFVAFSEVLDLLQSTSDKTSWLGMYKILPIKSEDWIKFLGYDPKLRRFNNIGKAEHWYQLDVSSLARSEAFRIRWEQLQKIYENKDTYTTEHYMPYLIKSFFKDYWNQRIIYEKNVYIKLTKDELYTWLSNVYSRDAYLTQIRKEFNSYMKGISSNYDDNCSLCVSTIHKVKGLEYDNVWITYLSSGIFPDIDLIKSRKYPQQYETSLIEEELRITYVAITRAIHNINLLYDINSPSVIIEYIIKAQQDNIIMSTALGRTSLVFK